MPTEKRAHNITLGLVGNGRLAKHLVPKLIQSGLKINQWCIRDTSQHEVVKNKYGIQPIVHASDMEDISDIILVMVSDREIATVAASLHISIGLVCHTSGTTPVEVLPQHNAGIFYPLNTFNGIDNKWDENTPLFVHAKNEKTLCMLESFAGRVSNKVHIVSPLDLKVINLSAVIAQNFTNHLIAQAEGILTEHELDRSILQPLLQSMIKNLTLNPAQVNQTGPAARADENTLALHDEMLKDTPELAHLYTLLSKAIQKKKED